MNDPDIHTEKHLVNLELSDKTQAFNREKMFHSVLLPSTRIPINPVLVINL